MTLIQTRLANLGATPEAIEKLEKYVDLLQQWNKAINLVAPSTLKDIWSRHILDSAQLWPIIQQCHAERSRGILDPPTSAGVTIIDLGSGGGLPGLVLAMLGAEHVTMIESDTRKCVFLREVSRETFLANVTVINERIEKAPVTKANFVTARALAPLEQLLEWSEKFVAPEGYRVFLKGQDVAKEMAALPEDIRARVVMFDSVTEANAKVVML